MKSKKALMSASFIVGLIITIAGFMVVTPLVVKFMGEDVKKAENVCRMSVGARAATTIKVGGAEASLGPLLCKTIDIEISGTKEEVKEKLAYLMARCWWMFYEGSYEEILKGGMRKILPEFEAKNDCFMCYNVIVEESKDFKEGEKISQKELAEYLMNEQHYLYNMSYLEYIQSFGGSGRVLMFNDIEPRHAYGISFAAKNKEPGNWWVEAGVIGGGVALAVAGGLLQEVPILGQIVGGKMILTGFGLILGGGAYLTADINKILYTEREVSSIYLSDLKTAQYCFEGDIAGK